MMDQQINQYLAQTREQVNVEQRERHRDRDRRRDRDRSRRRGRGESRERSRDRYSDDRYGDESDRSYSDRYSHDSYSSEYSYNRRDSSSHGDSETPGGYGRYSRESRSRNVIEYNHTDRPDYNSERSQGGDYSPDGSRRGDRESSSSRYEDREKRNSRERDGGNEERGGERWMTTQPTSTVLLRGLPAQLDEKDIRAELMLFGAPVKDVRLMKRKDTGASRGFAFVEFQNLQDAQRWMEQNQGQLTLLNQHTVSMYFSTPKNVPVNPDPSRQQDAWARADWLCSKCGVHNFRRREHCFKCKLSREESDRTKEGDGFDQVGNNPCNTLIFRGLDALTIEENITAALGQLSTIVVKNVKVIRDELTGTSRSYGFVEFNTLADATTMLDTITNREQLFEVDGKAIMVAYAKNTFSTVLATLNQSQQWQQQQGQAAWEYSQGEYTAAYYPAEGATGFYDSAGTFHQYDPQSGQYVNQNYDYSAYYNQYGQPATTSDDRSSTQTDVTNAAAAVAQAAIQQAQAAKQYHKQHEEAQKQIVQQIQQQQKLVDLSSEERLVHQAQEWSSTTQPETPEATDYTKYPVPDVSTYQYDETSGYYYDPTTGLYYDASSQYYYNAQAGQFLYWDGEKETYLPAPSDAQNQAPLTFDHQERSDDPKNKKEKEKKEKVKVAKKIAKDMEKWAKTLNAQKEAMKDGFRKSFQPIGPGGFQNLEKESASADAGFAILEKRAMVDRALLNPRTKEDKRLMPPPPMPGKGESKPGLVASYGGDSDSEDEPEGGGFGGATDEAKLVDYSKMACLLCKRQFPNKEALQRHIQLSDLHKKNLDELRKAKGSAGSTNGSQQYRDRAKERREKYGVPEPPLPKKRNMAAAGAPDPVPFEQPTKTGIGNDNIGNKLLQKMGWSEGQGLGRAGQGIVDPVKAEMRQQSAGLGARGSTYTVEPGATYKDTVKKMMFQRYHDME